MKQNPSQGIHEYNLDDVYTPGDANARRERIHFDFVVTAEQLECYKLLHPGTIDVGNLILSNKDGTDGVPLEHPLGGSISILIDAHTTEDDVFDFYNSRIISGDQIFMGVVVDAWRAGYNGDALVHFYTRDPYSITFGSTSGGIAYHSTPEAYVNIKDATGNTSGWDGICKVGVCKVEGTYNRYGREGWTGSGGFTLLYEKCISGRITWEDADTSTRPKDNTVPGAVCAPWMSSDVDCEISVTSGLLHKYGIYNRIKQAYDLGATPSILAETQGGLSKLRFVSMGGSDSSAFFAFEGDGKRLTIGYNDSLTWKATGGMARKAVLVDTDVPSAYTKPLHVGRSITQAAGSILTKLESWTDIHHPLALRDLLEIDWYTWDGMQEGSAIYTNDNNVLTIDADSLDEGMVYKATIHIVNLDPSSSGREVSADTAVTPAKPILPNSLNGTAMPEFSLQFASLGSLVPIYGWGIDSQPGGSTTSYKFRLHWPIASPPSTNPYQQSLQEISWGTGLFTKYDGKVIALLY